MKIGIIDLDTSHPQHWIPLERELGHEIVGLWDSGTVHPASYVESFAAQHNVPNIYTSLENMVADVDLAIIHSCDWDSHVPKARPFIEAGRAVLVDKPIAGCLRDIRQVIAWSRAGARISGGSSLRFCDEIAAWAAQPESERGIPHTVFCGCGVDEFNYGIHAFALMSAIMGPGVDRIRHLGHLVQRRIQVTWKDGRQAVISVGKTDSWLPFHATIVTERGVTHCQPDPSKLYRALLNAVLPFLAGAIDAPPVPVNTLVEPELCAIAAARSWAEGDREVRLDEPGLEDASYDGAAFAAEYKRQRYPET